MVSQSLGGECVSIAGKRRYTQSLCKSVVLTVPPGPSILSRAAAATLGAAIVFSVNELLCVAKCVAEKVTRLKRRGSLHVTRWRSVGLAVISRRWKGRRSHSLTAASVYAVR